MQNGMLTSHNGATVKLRAFWNRLGVSPPISLHLFSLKRTERSSAESSELCLRHLMFLSPRFAVQRWAKPNSPRSKSVLHMVTIHLPALLVRTSRLAEIVRPGAGPPRRAGRCRRCQCPAAAGAMWPLPRGSGDTPRKSGGAPGAEKLATHRRSEHPQPPGDEKLHEVDPNSNVSCRSSHLGGTRRQLASLLRTGPWGEGNESQSCAGTELRNLGAWKLGLCQTEGWLGLEWSMREVCRNTRWGTVAT